ncbi:alpha/beta hydrolase [Paenibacillus sanguinis]|uniref:alpha/beta hydrolase n=1 Tax=Paenibacillus sanguinis TaxID=225906 RepID=UPI0003792402|nr:alpha/beta hydrolase [Paenibacillus sanguinis]
MEIIIKKVPDSPLAGGLDPRVRQIATEQAEKLASLGQQDMKELKADFASYIEQVRAMMGWPNQDITTMEVTTEEIRIPGRDGEIRARSYTVQGNRDYKPAVVFFHGGAFIAGTIQTVENACKYLAEQSSAVVVSVDYRLAPEHPFPAGVHDCFDAVKWVYENSANLGINREQITVAGDSAGGNLAAVCALMDRDLGTGMIKYQALLYPTVNMAGTETDDFKWSIDQYEINNNHELTLGTIYALSSVAGIAPLYVPDNVQAADPYISPLHGHLEGLPPAIIIVGEFDYLRLEGEAYGRKLERSGVPVRMIRYAGMDHGFIDKIGLYPQAADCIQEVAQGMKELFSSD